MRTLLTAALLASIAVPAGAIAQNPPQPTPPPTPQPRERSFTFRWGPGSEDHMTLMHRGRLGITVDMRADASRDTVGALIAGVLPGGAADRAGVHAGDVVVRFNGTRLAAPAANADDGDSDQSRPAMRLIKIASRLDPGDTVILDVRRDGRPRTITFQAEESDMDMLSSHMESRLEPLMQGMDGMGPFLGKMMDRMPGRISVSIDGALSDVELVQVNADLGQYFGTTDGLLVTNVGSDSALGLKAGDVILSIGGRHPVSPAHAMRILATYDPGETIAFEVMRQRRRITVNGHMPQPGDRAWRIHRNSFTIPVSPRLPFMDGDAPVIMIPAKRVQQIET